jgi:hypothetical protein
MAGRGETSDIAQDGAGPRRNTGAPASIEWGGCESIRMGNAFTSLN